MSGQSLMTNDKYTFENLSSKYGDFKVPTYKISIDGNDLLSAESLVVRELKIDLTCENEASGCVLEVFGAYDIANRRFNPQIMEKFFQLGKKVSIDAGYIKTVNVFKGYISGVVLRMGNEAAGIRVECTDVKGIMMNTRTTEQRTENKLDDVVSSILGNQAYNNFCEGTQVDSISTPERKIEVAGESDFDFLVRLAARINYEFFVCQGKVYFRKPMPLKAAVISLEWGYNILSFERRASLEGQVLELEVRSADVDKGKMISGIATSNVQMSKGPSAKKALQKLKKVVVDSSVGSEQEAQERAEVLLKKLNQSYVTANIECIGIPEIVPGRFINVKKLGSDLDGDYYILRVTHSINESFFSTLIEARLGD
ncbi:phage protein D [Anaerobacterium chartisolvens]|uniref:Phage protein D n=2 Tax=Anaerobacterium chartisolvens TaxID=1297424 RepID=A0A369ASP5_9FIRM|nr:phage protein D [Anaerobacterium chartisolvens]